jgi:pimeloyl-ACP methyl ester carboxylesterase
LVVCGIATGASTLAAALAAEGHPVLADGVVCIDGNPPTVVLVPEARPPRLTLWPDVVEAFRLDPSDGEIVRPSLPSRAFGLGPPPPSRPVPLGALVSLGVADSRDAAFTPERLSGFAAVATLLKAFWHPHLTEDLGMAKQQFQWAATIAGRTPTVLLPPGRDDIRASCRLLVKAALEVMG